MTSNELAPLDLSSQKDFALAVTQGEARYSILPESYRGNPANVLVAVGLGSAMGLTPAESLYRISVIKGKPSASAELIAANVRKAGHKLRVKVTEDPPSATATIVRADDPDEPISITRDMKWAERMGLAAEPNYRKQPATMLSYRAITACARLACPEALYGVSYTPDEAWDIPADPSPTEPPRAKAGDFVPAQTVPVSSATVEALAKGAAEREEVAQDITDAEEIPVEDPPAEPEQPASFPAERNRISALFAQFGKAGFTTDARSAEGRKARLDYMTNVLGREINSSNELTAWECEKVIDTLKIDAAALEDATTPEG